MPNSSRTQLLYKQIFDLFPLQARNALYAKAEYRNYRRGEVVFRRDDEGSYMGGVMSGRLKATVSSREGKQMLVTLIEKGELFGEVSMFDDMPRAVDVVVESDCTLIIIHRDDLMPLLRAHPDAMIGVSRMLCHRIRMYIHTLELVALQSLAAKLGRFLLRLAREHGVEREDGSVVISPRLSQAEIGQQLACSRESVNKQLGIFTDLGLLALDGDEIILLNIDGLKQAIRPIS
jgi:CRP-like cAMP-binding protein